MLEGSFLGEAVFQVLFPGTIKKGGKAFQCFAPQKGIIIFIIFRFIAIFAFVVIKIFNSIVVTTQK